eukprot:m.9328 g.9328  ORF g.9328 m.9328 type:complete len:175 (+) comp2964_c0_seq1:1657-2181(+)
MLCWWLRGAWGGDTSQHKRKLAEMMRTLVLLAALAAVCSASSLARGWGDGIEWRSLEAGKAEALASQKPLMVIIHKTWCGACKALKPRVAASEEVAELSRQFVMVNLEDDEEPNDPAFTPDGGYIPRILFLNSAGEVQDDIINTSGNPKYKYYYTSGENVAAGMRNALNVLKKN